MSFSAYPAYKNSGVQWIGSIPEHWDASRLRNIFFIQKRIAGKLGFDVLSITNKGVKVKDVESGDGQLSSDYSKYQLVMKGEFAMNHMDLVTGYVDISAFNGVTSPDYRVFSAAHPELDNPRFMLRLLQNAYHQKLFFPFGQGSAHLGRWRLPAEEFKDFFFPRPPLFEQTQIARFLDHETARIDALIEEQQRLIELLKEKRQAVISHAVTKGLDPTVPMKDSGVEWLGEVPAHWTVRKVSVDFLASKGPRGALLTKEYCHENAGEYPVYSGQTENGGILGEIADFDIDLDAEGAILSTTVGAKAMSVMHISGRISLSQNCMIIRPLSSDVKVRFFFYHVQPLFSLERRMIPDHMQPSFRMEDLYSFRVAVPPVSEQNQIAEYLDAAANRFDELIGEGDNGIALLQERRSALISAAVTGKIDVRGWQPPARAEAPECEEVEAV